MKNNYNKTAYNFLIFLKFIMFNPKFQIDEILQYLSENYNIILYRESILKYIRSAKELGFVFKKNNANQYELLFFPKEFAFSSSIEKNILNSLYFVIHNNLFLKNYDISSFYKKLLPFLSEKTNKKLYEKIKIFPQNNKRKKFLLTQLEEFFLDNKQLFLKYSLNSKNIYSTKIEPIKIININAKKYCKYFDINRKEINIIEIQNIIDVEQTKYPNKNICNKNYAKLKFSNKLAQKYHLKENEKIIKQTENYLIIETFYDDKIDFFNRVLKYMEHCEILSPSNIRNEFVEYLNNLYQIYDCPFVN